MSTETALAWALADAASACFTEHDQTTIYTALGAGETYAAIVRTLTIAVRARHSLPTNLITELTTWLDGYTGNEYEPRIRCLLSTYTRRRGAP
jgi:hypothetical protein